VTNTSRLTVANAFAEFKDDLKLEWISGKDGGDRLLSSERGAAKRPRLLGPLSFNSPNRIQVIGKAEARLFKHAPELEPSRFEYSLKESCELFVITDNAD